MPSGRIKVKLPKFSWQGRGLNKGRKVIPMLRRFRIVSICLFSLLLTASAWGQKDAGSIAGTIRDASGAAVPQAKITVTEVDKGTSLIYSTGSSGDYVASPIAIGRYSVKVE